MFHVEHFLSALFPSFTNKNLAPFRAEVLNTVSFHVSRETLIRSLFISFTSFTTTSISYDIFTYSISCLLFHVKQRIRFFAFLFLFP